MDTIPLRRAEEVGGASPRDWAASSGGNKIGLKAGEMQKHGAFLHVSPVSSSFCFVLCRLPRPGTVQCSNRVGVVQDSSKAAITDAKLKLINTQTGTENDSNTNHAGGFLLPGDYPGRPIPCR